MATERDVIKDALEYWDDGTDAIKTSHNLMVSDLHFAHGRQWPEDIRRRRELDGGGRPCLTINTYPAFERQVLNEIRMMRPTINVKPIDSAGDKDTADILNGLIRSIEASCNAEAAIDWAAMYQVRVGRGYFSLDIEFDEQTFENHIVVRRERNPFAIILDPQHEEHDASDANWGFKGILVPKEEFDERWPDAEGQWPMNTYGMGNAEYYNRDRVHVVKFYEIVHVKSMMSLVIDPNTGQPMTVEGDVPGALDKREFMKKQVVSRLMTNQTVLEEEVFPGEYIPIIPVTGEEVDIEGEIHYKGMVRDLRDTMIGANLMRSALVEQYALQPKSPFYGPRGSFQDEKWNNYNENNYPYLEYDVVEPGLKPERADPPAISPAAIQILDISDKEMKQITGLYQAALGDSGNEISGVAIQNRQAESDVSNFHYSDNLARSIRHYGRVMISMIKDVYTGPRAARIIDGDRQDKMVHLNQQYIDPDTQKPVNYDLSVGRYDVSVETGPSYATQRQKAAGMIMDIMDKYPEAGALLGDMMVQNLDWPGGQAEQAAERLRATLPAEILRGESPAVAQMIQQVEQEAQTQIEQLTQYNQVLQANLAELAQQLRDRAIEYDQKQQEIDIKASDQLRKEREGQQDHTVEVAELGLKYNKDTGGLN